MNIEADRPGISTAEVELDGKASAAACQTVRHYTVKGLANFQIIWGFGESSAKASNFLHAAEWCEWSRSS